MTLTVEQAFLFGQWCNRFLLPQQSNAKTTHLATPHFKAMYVHTSVRMTTVSVRNYELHLCWELVSVMLKGHSSLSSYWEMNEE